MNIRTDILLRVYVAFGLIVVFAFAVLFKLFHVQFAEGERWSAMADSLSTKYQDVEAVRGNIYSIDGSLLATSVPEYELRMDMLAAGIEDDEVFREKVDSLAAKLSDYFGDKSHREYSLYFLILFVPFTCNKYYITRPCQMTGRPYRFPPVDNC